MADLFDYLDWRGDLSFSQVPLSSLDMLLLSHLTYSNIEGLVSSSFDERISFNQLGKIFKTAPDYEQRTNTGVLINKRTSELLLKCSKTKRFKNVQLCGFVSVFDEDKVEQFAAVTFIADDKKIISYRGTDDTVVGWYEDFNLACMDEIPAQKDALLYFKNACEKMEGNFSFVGHSKGGNLAVNTSVKCGLEAQKRIDEVYNFDGPGFYKEFFESSEYKNIEKRLYSFYPEFSVVGMIFNHPEKYKILKSTGFAIMEHDAMTWQLMGKDFTTVKNFDEASVVFHNAFNDWVSKLSVDERKKFVDALFQVINAPGLKTLDAINKTALSSSAKMIGAFASLDKTTKKEVRRIISLFRDAIHTEFPFIKIFELKK